MFIVSSINRTRQHQQSIVHSTNLCSHVQRKFATETNLHMPKSTPPSLSCSTVIQPSLVPSALSRLRSSPNPHLCPAPLQMRLYNTTATHPAATLGLQNIHRVVSVRQAAPCLSPLRICMQTQLLYNYTSSTQKETYDQNKG